MSLRALIPILALLAAACASSGSRHGAGNGLRVTLRDYASGQRFELVSDSHTDPVEYYSTPRGDAARKVQTDPVVDALLGELERQGFAEHAQEGRAPSRGGQLITRAFEVQDGESLRHWAIGNGSQPEERIAFNECVKPFLQLYNVSQSYQAVENPHGHAFFEESSAPVPVGRR